MERIKNLFSTPKKAMLTCLIIVLAVVVLSVGAVFAAVYIDRNEDKIEHQVENTIAPADTETVPESDQQANADQNQTDQQPEAKQPENADQSPNASAAPQDNQPSKKISQKKAESIALKDAGFSAGQVTNLYSHLDYDDGYYEYEVQFYKGDMEYDYTLDAATGNIHEKDIESIYD